MKEIAEQQAREQEIVTKIKRKMEKIKQSQKGVPKGGRGRTGAKGLYNGMTRTRLYLWYS